jgi:hypothetical protein
MSRAGKKAMSWHANVFARTRCRMCARRAVIRPATPVEARLAHRAAQLCTQDNHRVHLKIIDSITLISERTPAR